MSKLYILPILIPIAYCVTLLLEKICDKLLSSKASDLAEWDMVYEPPLCSRNLLWAGVWCCLAAGCYFPHTLKGQVLSCLLLVQLLVVSLIDYKYQFIFDEQNGLLFLLGWAKLWDYPTFWKEPVCACVGAFVVMFVLAVIMRGAMGGGDVKLMAALGVWLGVWGIGQTLFYGTIAGGVAALVLLVVRRKGRKDYFAYGPYLCLGAVYAWYLQSYRW